MRNTNNRREFLRQLGWYTMGVGMLPAALAACNTGKSTGEDSDSATITSKKLQAIDEGLFFKISLAEWSFHKALFAGKMSHLDFPERARKEFGISGVEYVNQFFKDKANDKTYLGELKKRCEDLDVRSVLIMCDGEGEMGDLDAKKRLQAVENHYKWVEAAQFLGCHSIRVNAAGEGSPEAVAQAAVDSLTKLATFGKDHGINVIVENHGGISSDGKWLSGIMKAVNMPECGTLPDFGNFCLKGTPEHCEEAYDRYQGVAELMPFAEGVSAKTYNFGPDGNEVEIDYGKMLSIVKNAGYNGFVGIEYEGEQLSEEEGIRKTIALLQKYGKA
ncbi:sugar phosphate isomerase/epimerase [Chitinophaga silvatica]|uniref:Sugar phosphate isomerase/epimerase n=1 Tax=Chitinophaga silvatica TaxID=2282649 RepID=A0A3E1YEN1_9BACT|nr:sugar phosphate isomerase/epimerase family protein [Chitinophaga silvatica]RFS24986.1 sugar phosphate isomerase/epimerase [Chitinophaga silvatica]